MSKEYLEYLTNKIRYKKEHIRDDLYRLYIKKNEIEFLEKELQRLEAIDNADPNEALKSFDCIALNIEKVEDYIYMDCIEHLNTIKQYILKAQKMEKEIAEYKQLAERIRRNYYG